MELLTVIYLIISNHFCITNKRVEFTKTSCICKEMVTLLYRIGWNCIFNKKLAIHQVKSMSTKVQELKEVQISSH